MVQRSIWAGEAIIIIRAEDKMDLRQWWNIDKGELFCFPGEKGRWRMGDYRKNSDNKTNFISRKIKREAI